jgi:hypothetical protein
MLPMESVWLQKLYQKKGAPVGESGPRTHNRACPTKPEKKIQPDCPRDALKF